jgi:hypothetical protein
MSENKTRPTEINVNTFLEKVMDPLQREDCVSIIRIMEEVSGEHAIMWGSSIIGFGNYHYKYESGREGDMPVMAFSPRKQAITIYLKGYLHLYEKELANLGKYKTGKGCLYIKSLKDIDQAVLKNVLSLSLRSNP